MKVVLKFELPDEKAEYTWAIRGPEYFRVLRNLDELLRKALKYDHLSDRIGQKIEIGDREKVVLETIRDFLSDETTNDSLLDEIE